MPNKNDDPTLAKCGPEEEIFVLRARDPLAPAIVERWIELAEAMGVCNVAKLESAKRVAQRMRRMTGRRLPD